ncbi:sigma-70 family RNA polymerase sigma factor [Candidatus Uabimicrobium sp. HlEnr_7]|uniref:sigma-70 family RNA polymerase sigma factor n=1 Tax=Candidatus Uabimicrobium helgolandensis TaxID=3095367 RepID=UPI003558C3BD
MKNNQNSLSDPNNWVELYGDQLLRFTLARICKRESAEEVVQETFLAALKARKNFSGRSSEKTWLFGILKHKIIDHYRKMEKQQPISIDDTENEYFDKRGHWKKSPKRWPGNPQKVLEKKEFWEVFEKCIAHLPLEMEQVFQLKMLEKMNSEDICTELQITSANLWVRLHRARFKMRQCLEKCWFTKTG